MSDNRRVYRTIRTTMRQLFPTEPKGNQVRMLATLAAINIGRVAKPVLEIVGQLRKALLGI